MSEDLIPAERIQRRILEIRGQSVIVDADLAELYGVETRRLNEQVKRNSERFPLDFVFQLTPDEYENLKSQSAISSGGHGGRRTPPYAFTEHGAIMAASVLNSERAIEMSVFVVRAFVSLRGMLSSQLEMLRKLEELEDKVGAHAPALADDAHQSAHKSREATHCRFSKQSIGLPSHPGQLWQPFAR